MQKTIKIGSKLERTTQKRGHKFFCVAALLAFEFGGVRKKFGILWKKVKSCEK
jgi:hypothetical protein